MSILQAHSPIEPQGQSRNWIAETLVVAGILAFGYFAITLEAARKPAPGPIEQAEELPRDLLR